MPLINDVPVTDDNPVPVKIVSGGGGGGGGDASAANQVTEIAKLTSIDGKTPAVGAALVAASTPVTLASDDGIQAKIGIVTETAPATDTASSGLNGRLQRVAQRLTSLIALVPAALGQTTKAASFAVTVASDDDLQAKIGIVTETAPATDTASSGLNGRLQRVAQRLTSLIALVPATLGQTTKAASFAVTVASDDDLQAKIGIVTETAPATDTASSGLNGRLQRVAQRLTVAIINMVVAGKQSFTRPADTTAYSIGDLIANSTTAGSVAPISFTGVTKTGSGGSGRIAKLLVSKDGANAANIRVHFLRTSHAVTNGDNGALIFTSMDMDNYIGFMDVSFTGTDDGVGTGGALVEKSYDAPLDYVLASGDTIYCFLEALSAFTPGNASVHTLKPTFEVWS